MEYHTKSLLGLVSVHIILVYICTDDTSHQKKQKKRGDNLCFKPIIIGNDERTGRPIKVACHKCAECMQTRANEWGIRCHFELMDHQENCFITLTYENNPVLLNKKHMQDFIKRLRKQIAPKKIKYFSCGEYGDLKLRPHYHLIIFGYDFKDKIFWKNSKSGKPIYKSNQLDQIWGKGSTTVQEANAQTARYSARYSAKLKDNLSWPQNKQPEYNTMSQNLGVKSIIQNIDKYLETDEIYVDGYAYKIPNIILKKYLYLDKIYNQDFEVVYRDLKEARKYNKIIYNPEQQNKIRERLSNKGKLHQALREL